MELKERLQGIIDKEMPMSREWMDIDIESDNYPMPYEDVLVYTVNKEMYIGHLVQYGDDPADWNWNLSNSSVDMPRFDHVTHFKYLPQPPQTV